MRLVLHARRPTDRGPHPLGRVGGDGGGMVNLRVGCFIWDFAHQADVVTTNSSDVGLDPTNSIPSSGPRKLSQNVGATAWAWVCDYLGLPLPAVGRSTVSGGRFVI